MRPHTALRFLELTVAAMLLAALVPALALSRVRAVQAPGDIFISELHYDNAGTDTGEFVEITAPAGTDLSGWSIVRYDGVAPAVGVVYTTPAATETVPAGAVVANQSVGFGTVVISYPTDGLQNGSSDGLALRNASGIVVELLSWEGVVTASNGPAAGLVSDDVGVAETSSTPVGASLSRVDLVPGSYTWVSTSTSTQGAPNPGLVIDGTTVPEPGNDPVTASCGSEVLAAEEGSAASRTVTATDPDGTVVSLAVTSTAVPGISIGATTPAGSVGGEASAELTVGAATAAGTYEVEVTATNDDAVPQSGSCTLTVTVTSPEATFARMHWLVDHYVGTGALPASKAFLFHDRLTRAERFATAGKIAAARSQLEAFGTQAHDFAPLTVADALAREATRLAGLL